MNRLGRWTRRLIWVGVWAVLAFMVASALFLASSRTTLIAGHEAVLRPSLDGYAQLSSGPVLPDLRLDTGYPIGVRIELGKTDATSTDELVQRYGLLASNPDGQIAKIHGLLVEMGLQAALRGAALGLVPIGLWLLLGARRREELVASLSTWRGAAGASALLVVGVLVWQPWVSAEPHREAGEWQPLGEFIGARVPVPEALGDVQILVDATASESKRLVTSTINTYEKSKSFYTKAATDAAALNLRQPGEGETVVLLVSDRHDNIGMDAPARAIAEAAGATAVLDAGDDTSTGSDLEAFSLDSLNKAFEGYDRWAVTGNHDHGPFVGRYLAEAGWQRLEPTVVEGPGGVSLLGIDDPRSSGLGDWRDESGLTFDEARDQVTEAACAQTEPVGLILVHDTSLARDALAQGCVVLALGGHLHVQVGPTAIAGPEGQLGFSYTNGTTGGAAFSIAIGSKPKRDAQVSLITIRDGRPVGIQPVTLRTDGRYLVADWIELNSSLIGVVVPGSVPSADATPPEDTTDTGETD